MKLAQAQQQTERHEEDLRAANRRVAAQGRVAALLEAEVAHAKAGLAAVQQCTLEHASAGGLLPMPDKTRRSKLDPSNCITWLAAVCIRG